VSLTIHERAQSSGALISSGAPIISGILISSSALIGSSKLGRCKLGRFSLPACRNVAIVFDVRLCDCANVRPSATSMMVLCDLCMLISHTHDMNRSLTLSHVHCATSNLMRWVVSVLYTYV